LPFPGSSFGEVLIGHLQQTPPAPRELNPDIPEAYEAVILKALAKKQDERQQTMRQLHDEIKAVMDSLGISAELPRALESDLPPPSATSMHKLKQGARTTNPKARPSNPGAAMPTPVATQATQATQALIQPAPPKSKLGLFIAIAAGLILVGGAIGFAMHQASKRAEAEAAQLAERAASEAREAARKAAEEEHARQVAAQQALPIGLVAVSEPLGASVTGDLQSPAQREGPLHLRQARFSSLCAGRDRRSGEDDRGQARGGEAGPRRRAGQTGQAGEAQGGEEAGRRRRPEGRPASDRFLVAAFARTTTGFQTSTICR